MIYGQSVLQKLDRLQYRGLRVCTGALLIEAEETPLEIRREKLSLVYWAKLKGSGDEHPAVKAIQSCWEYSRFQRRGF